MPDQNQTKPQTSNLRKPPMAGGPKRVPEETAQPAKKTSWWASAFPYLLAGGSTGLGIGIGLTNFFS